jgi:hypothetical protein
VPNRTAKSPRQREAASRRVGSLQFFGGLVIRDHDPARVGRSDGQAVEAMPGARVEHVAHAAVEEERAHGLRPRHGFSIARIRGRRDRDDCRRAADGNERLGQGEMPLELGEIQSPIRREKVGDLRSAAAPVHGPPDRALLPPEVRRGRALTYELPERTKGLLGQRLGDEACHGPGRHRVVLLKRPGTGEWLSSAARCPPDDTSRRRRA